MPKIEYNFAYENNFYLTASVDRIGKFAAHLELFRKVLRVSGAIVECGVFKGVSLSRFIKFRSLFENAFSKKIIAFDTFGKFPEARHKFDDVKRLKLLIENIGNRSIEKDYLISILKELNLYQNIELVKGNVTETIPQYKAENPHLKISLLNIDVDLGELLILQDMFLFIALIIPFCDNRGYVMEHRLVMEKYLRKHKPNHPALIEINGIKYLRSEWIVHHNGTKYPIGSFEDRSNNRIKNLKLFASHKEHIKFHCYRRRKCKIQS